MVKVRALITLVVGKNKQIAPNGVCDVGENEAKRLISLGYAESLKKNTSPTNTGQENNGDKSNEYGGGQSVPPLGQTGDIQE